jgi:hypothetical protein
LILAVIPIEVNARVFDMNQLNIAPYVRGTVGPSMIEKEAYVHEIGSGNSITGKSPYNYGGEIGLLLSVQKFVNLRLGAELYQASPVTNANGTSSTGSVLYSLDSSVFVFNPQVSLEFIFKNYKESRFLFNLGVGRATVSLTNVYTMTAAGTTALSLNSFTEKGTDTVSNGYASLGWEAHFADKAMIMFEAGYKYMPVDSLTHAQDEKTIAQRSGATSGSALLNDDKSQRKFDLSGGFVGISFRFYIQ